MATYTMKADNIFVRCIDMVVMDVYELDSPYTFPKKAKSWGNLGISIGPGNEYEALKIGDKEIKAGDLQKLMKDLFNSRLIVNREGLGFVGTAGVTGAMLEVEYYRVFDLFDWSKYQVTTSLNTKWARRNFMDGCPMDIIGCNANSSGNGDDVNECKNKLREKEKELENEKLKHKEELEKAAAKHREELDEVKGVVRKREEELKKKQDEVDRLKEELAIAERNMLEERKENQKLKEELDIKKAELEAQIKGNMVLEEELKICSFERSGIDRSVVSSTMDFYSRFAPYVQQDLPPSKITFRPKPFVPGKWPPYIVPPSFVPFSRVLSVSSLPEICLNCIPSHISDDFDRNNWRVLHCSTSYANERVNVVTATLAYYDGDRYSTPITIYQNKFISIPSPCSTQSITKYQAFGVCSIMGVGHRLTLDWISLKYFN